MIVDMGNMSMMALANSVSRAKERVDQALARAEGAGGPAADVVANLRDAAIHVDEALRLVTQVAHD